MNSAVVLAKNDGDILDVLLSPDDVKNNFDNAIFHLKPRPSKQQRPDSTGTSRRDEEGGGKEEISSSPMSTNVADIDVDVNDMNRFDNLNLAFLWMTPREFIVSSEPMLPPRLNLSHKMESGEVLCNQHVHINVASAPSFPHLSNPKTSR